MKQDEDIWQYQDDAAVVLEYWKKRCLAAEKFIEGTNPYIYGEQEVIYDDWMKIKNSKPC